MEAHEVRQDIVQLKRYWGQRAIKFSDWYQLLLLIDQLTAKNMESYCSNEPQTFYNMAHYLVTKGELTHSISIMSETAIELDKRARVDRGCEYMWKTIDDDRQLGGNQPFVDELMFYMLLLGWYSVPLYFDQETGTLQARVWSPADVFPKYANDRLYNCVHSYKITEEEAKLKAELNGWSYQYGRATLGLVQIDDYFIWDGKQYQNMVLIGDQDVTGWIPRPEMQLLVAPVGGFPDRGSILQTAHDWRRHAGRGIFAVNESVSAYFNKWKSMISQILRDTAQPITQEFSASPQATVEQLRERGAFFHYSPGEQGLIRLPPGGIPIEMQAHLLEIRRELQKGSFNDAVYGMVEGEAGYALSLLATSSANQILYPFMDGKHFIISKADEFWLSNLKTSRRVFEIKGKFSEKLSPTDIPDNVKIMVDSEVATPKDWLERGTIGGMLRQDIDEATLLGEVYKFSDPEAIMRRKRLDRTLNHPMTQNIELISGYRTHAEYLESRGDLKQATLFRNAAAMLETQMGGGLPGEGSPAQATQVAAARATGGRPANPRVSAGVAPPEAQAGYTPQQMRQIIGTGRMRRG